MVGTASYAKVLAAVAADVPYAVVTRTVTRPSAWAGDVTRRVVLDRTVKGARVVPNVTAVAPPRRAPVTVTTVPPRTGPADTDSEATEGGGAYVNRAREASGLVPPGVVTRTSTVPAAWAGAVTRRVVADTRTTFVVVVVPNRTDVARVSPVPVNVTTVPPPVPPLAGRTEPIVGTGS
jgi:hypothetical protein